MKKLSLLALCALLSVGAFAQKSKSKNAAPTPPAVPATEVMTTEQRAAMESQKSEPVAWPELDAFHKVMATTFHPAEKGNFKPIRTRSQELVLAVKNLIGNPFPEPYQKGDMKVLVAQLETQVTTVDKLVQSKANDKDLMASLNEAHEIFHKIAGMCSKEGEEHSH